MEYLIAGAAIFAVGVLVGYAIAETARKDIVGK